MDEKLRIRVSNSKVDLVLLSTSTVSKTQFAKSTHKLPLVVRKSLKEKDLEDISLLLNNSATDKGYDIIGEMINHGHVSPKTENWVIDYLCSEGYFFKSYADTETYKLEETQKTLKQEKEDINMSENKQGKGLVEDLFGSMENMFDGLVEPFEDGEVAITFQGTLAVKNRQGNYVSYNPLTNRIVNSHKLILPGSSKLIIPYPVQVMNVGDIIKFNGTFYFIESVTPDKVTGVNLRSGASTNLLKEESVLGLNLFTKAFSFLGNGFGNSGLFGGNLGMLFALQALTGNGQNGDMFSGDSLKAMLPLMLFSSMGNGSMMNMQLPFMQAPANQNVPVEIKEEEVEVEEIPVQSPQVLDKIVETISLVSDELKKVNERLDKLENSYQ